MEDGEESSSWTLKAVWRNACTPRCPHHPEEPATYFCRMLSWNEVETHTGSGLFLLLHFRVPHWVLALEHVLCVLFCEFEMRHFFALMLSLAVDISKSTHRWTSVNLNKTSRDLKLTAFQTSVEISACWNALWPRSVARCYLWVPLHLRRFLVVTFYFLSFVVSWNFTLVDFQNLERSKPNTKQSYLTA